MKPIYLESLDPKRKQAFLKLKPLSQNGILAGGTALMLQINHRQSYDFDIFLQDKKIEKHFRQIAKLVGLKRKILDQAEQKTFLSQTNIRFTLWLYPFKPLYPLGPTSSLPLFNLKDIALDKAYTLGRRPAWRDYVDLFFLLKDKHISLKSLIQNSQKKFKNLFDPKLFLQQLVFFQDIQDWQVKFIKKDHSPKQVQEFLKKEVLKFTHNLITY